MIVIEKQLSIFDILEPNNFCEDDHINEIVKFIENDFSKLNLVLKNKEYSVWNNVPKLGKRLTMIWDLKKISCDRKIHDKQGAFSTELNKSNYNNAVELAEKYNIELSIAVTPFFVMISTLKRKEK